MGCVQDKSEDHSIHYITIYLWIFKTAKSVTCSICWVLSLDWFFTRRRHCHCFRPLFTLCRVFRFLRRGSLLFLLYSFLLFLLLLLSFLFLNSCPLYSLPFFFCSFFLVLFTEDLKWRYFDPFLWGGGWNAIKLLVKRLILWIEKSFKIIKKSI